MIDTVNVKSEDYELSVKGLELRIGYDEDAEDPQNDDEPTAIIKGMHRKYQIGQLPEYNSGNFNGWEDFLEGLKEDWNPAVISPVYMMDHSGLSFSMGPYGGMYGHFDSGQVGYIFVPRTHLMEYWGWKNLNEGRRRELYEVMKTCLESYEQYVNGNLLRYSCYRDGEMVDSCGSVSSIVDIKDMVPDEFMELAEEAEESMI